MVRLGPESVNGYGRPISPLLPRCYAVITAGGRIGADPG
jgi:hypothetical protein